MVGAAGSAPRRATDRRIIADGELRLPAPSSGKIVPVVSGEELRRLMRRFPAGVAVVTVDVEGERLGLTVGSLVSLSREPALIGVAISPQAALHELLRAAGEFAASLLAGDQAPLAAHFARGVPPIAHWAGIDLRPGRTVDAPLLEGALGWLECRTVAEYVVGDHTFFVGEVLEAEHGRAGPPLAYVDRRYVSV